jgi:hypothetical protein
MQRKESDMAPTLCLGQLRGATCGGIDGLLLEIRGCLMIQQAVLAEALNLGKPPLGHKVRIL